MTSEQLEIFLAVADTGSFSEAAVRLYSSQPTISRQVRMLEEELGAELFRRSYKRVELTEIGRHVYDYAVEHRRREQQLLQSITLSSGRSGVIRIAVTPLFSPMLLHRTIRRFRQINPDFSFSLQECATPMISKLLESKSCELAIARRDQLPDLYDGYDLYTDHFVLALPKAHPLAGSPAISIQKLEHDAFLLFSHATSSYQTVLSLCKQAGFLPNIFYTGSQLLSVLELVRQGAGVTLLSRRSIPADYYDKLSFAELTQLQQQPFTLSLLRLRSGQLSPQAAEFWSYMGR